MLLIYKKYNAHTLGKKSRVWTFSQNREGIEICRLVDGTYIVDRTCITSFISGNCEDGYTFTH
jgi:hypothetical protein